jgi:hypothetical protein
MTPKRADAELRKLALDIMSGLVFGSWNLINQKDMPLVFMSLIFASKNQVPQDVGAVYEYYSEAGPRSINGYPIFTSCYFLTEAETDIVQLYCNELKKERNKFLNEESKTNTVRIEPEAATGIPMDSRNSTKRAPSAASDSATHVDTTNSRLLALFKRVTASNGPSQRL